MKREPLAHDHQERVQAGRDKEIKLPLSPVLTTQWPLGLQQIDYQIKQVFICLPKGKKEGRTDKHKRIYEDAGGKPTQIQKIPTIHSQHRSLL